MTPEEKLGQRKGWVTDFVHRGLDFDAACKEANISPEDVDKLKLDKSFMEIIEAKTMDNKIKFLDAWNKKVEKSKNPADAIKQLQLAFPHSFKEKEQAKEVPTQPVFINIGGGNIEEVKQLDDS